MPRQDGTVAIVTGGGRGIGYEVVRDLARLGVHVIIGIVSTTSTLTFKQGWRCNILDAHMYGGDFPKGCTITI